MLVLRHYPSEHYGTIFNTRTGLFVRLEEPGHAEPFWAEHGPELLDISITSWCDRGCSSCYRGASPTGIHMSVGDYELIMRQARRMHVAQVALGGGNPNQHPCFAEILRLTRSQYGIVPSYSTNGRGLTRQVLEATREYCGAVAVSAYEPYRETAEAIARLQDHQIKTTVHYVLSTRSLATAGQWLRSPPQFLVQAGSVVFLAYKAVGRGANKALLLHDADDLRRFFELACGRETALRVGFDSCLAPAIASYTSVSPTSYDACEAARFSMFISEDMRAYPCSFMAADHAGQPLNSGNMAEVWCDGKLFQHVRNRLQASTCSGCEHTHVCLGGCPVFPKLAVCSRGQRSGPKEGPACSSQSAPTQGYTG